MKPSRLFALVGVMTISFLISCNNSTEEKKENTDTTSKMSSTAPAETKPVNTIVTSPQNMLIVMHKVANYQKWLPFYEGHDTARESHSVHNYVIARGLTDTNMVLVAMKIDDVDKAKALVGDPNLKKVMQKAGVVGAPNISMYTMVWQDTANLTSTTVRSRTTFEVKDWDTWVKNFEMADAKQERADNGIVTRAYGHDIMDNKKVTLVTALTDTAKAFAYYKSDALKKRRAAGGVIGEPKRFLYTISKKY